MSKEWEDINVNKSDSSKVRFESPLVQSIYDGIGFLKDEATEILKEIDSTEFKQNIDEFDLEEFGENTMGQISDIVDDLSKFKDDVIDSDEVPEFVKESSRNAKNALNRDSDYVRRAKRKLDKLDSDNVMIDKYKINVRVIELCDKAIDVNYQNDEAYYLKGIALINLEKYDDAIEELIKFLALNESNLNARLAIADANRLNGDCEDAISVYNSVLKIDEESYDALTGKAHAYFDLEKYSEADEIFKKANAIEPLEGESLRIWEECLEKLEENDTDEDVES